MSTDIDITQDLDGGPGEGSLADVNTHATFNGGAVPAGAVPVGGEPSNVVGTPEPKAPATTEPSLRESLSKLFKEAGEQPAPAAADPATPAAPPALTKDAEGKYRRIDGTFASAEDITAFEAAQQPAAPEVPALDENVLRGMTPTELQQFQSLPAEIRQFVGRTMEGLNQRAARYGEYDTIEQHIIGPRRQLLAQSGSNPVAAINELFAMSDFAQRDPGQFVLWFANSRGMDLDTLLDARDLQMQNVDPQVQQLQGQVNNLSGQLQYFQSQQQQEANTQRTRVVENFAFEKDGAGQPLRPYLGEVTNEWAQQIAFLRQQHPSMPDAEVLQKAYEAACWGNPTVRGKMQQASLAAQARAEQSRAAAAAAAGSSVTGAPMGGTPSTVHNGNLSLREELEANFAQYRN